MNRSEQINEIAAAMAKAQGEIEGAVKDKSNPAFRSKYADLGAVWDAIRDPPSKNGISAVQFPRRVGDGIEVETVLMHSSGQWMSSTLGMPVAKADAHGHGSAITYARRFALSAICGVAPVYDDGNAAAGKVGGVLGMATNSLEAARQEIAAQTGNDKSTYRINADKKSADNAKTWANTAIETLNFASSREDVDGWFETNGKALAKLEENHPEQYERVTIAADNARDRYKAVAA